jgi:prephenate dehydrogenase
MFDKLLIVGPGLIGGSLGMAVREKGLARRVVGVGRRRESLARAVELGAVDETSLDLEAAAAGADLVVLATGVEMIAQQAAAVLPRMRKGALLTDVGSAKAAICRSVERVFSASASAENVRFVGGHPMAGSERRGIGSARADLFRGAVCILTPTPRTDPDGVALGIVRDLWEAVGCRVREMPPEEHDRLIAQISHLPHAAAACLVNAASDEALDLAASGFLDTTRVASGEPALWVAICMANREALLAALAALGGRLNDFARALQSGDAKTLEALLARAKSRRDGQFNHPGTKNSKNDGNFRTKDEHR